MKANLHVIINTNKNKNEGETIMNFVFFHNPDEENAYLSNWFYCDFEVDGVKFNSGEQYMMYSKAAVMGDNSTATKILAERDFSKIKKLGRMVKPFDGKLWDSCKEDVMFKGLKAKFEQNEDLKSLLLATGEDILAECAQKDLIWGIGLRMNSKDRFDPLKWKGKNLLGKTLMAVRAVIREK